MSVAIRTAQNVLLEYEPASLGERILAAMIDYLVLFSWFILVFAVPVSLGYKSSTFYTVVMLLPVVFYDLLSEWLLNGQSVGKIAMKTRVVMLDGSQPGLGAYLLRWLLRIVESPVFLGGIVPIITIAANGKGQRLGDIAAGTSVVRLKPAVSLDALINQPLAEEYAVQFPDVSLLSDRDITVVRAVVRQANSQTLSERPTK